MSGAMTTFWKRTTLVIVVATLGMATVLVAYASIGAASQPPPGLTAGVTALDQLPAEASVPADVVGTLGVLDPAVVGSPDQAAAQLRKLRSNLGLSGTDIYALRSRTGSVCFIALPHAAICPQTLQSGQAGLLFAIGGGAGTAEVPGVLVGVAADNVTGVELTVDGAAVPVTLENNAAFAELPVDADAAQVVIHYRGFDDETIALELGG